MAKLLEAGLTMDPKLVDAAVKAHDQALDSAISNPNLVASKADFAAVHVADARVIASAGQAKAVLSPQCLPRKHGAPDEISCRQQLR